MHVAERLVEALEASTEVGEVVIAFQGYFVTYFVRLLGVQHRLRLRAFEQRGRKAAQVGKCVATLVIKWHDLLFVHPTTKLTGKMTSPICRLSIG